MLIRYFHLNTRRINKNKVIFCYSSRLLHIRIMTNSLLLNRNLLLINLGCSILRVNFRILLKTGLPISSGKPEKGNKANSIFMMPIDILWRENSHIGRIILGYFVSSKKSTSLVYVYKTPKYVYLVMVRLVLMWANLLKRRLLDLEIIKNCTRLFIKFYTNLSKCFHCLILFGWANWPFNIY